MMLYVDGAAASTGGPGGVGYVAHYGDDMVEEGSLPLRQATNQQAEILAAAYGLDRIVEAVRVLVISDSEYVVRGFYNLARYRVNGWQTVSGGPVKNRAHWERLIRAAARHDAVAMEWVKGHNGNVWNERADRLAFEARKVAKDEVEFRALLAKSIEESKDVLELLGK